MSALPTQVECAPLAVKRALVDHAGLAVGVVVYHHRAVFDVLAGVHEVDAEHVEVALFAA